MLGSKSKAEKMKRYTIYKDSGIKWIGEIPSHWNLLRAKNMFQRMFRPVREEDEVITCFRDGQVTLRKNRRTEGFTESFKEIGYQGIRKGDLVIHQMDAFAGSIGVSDSDGKGTPVYICLLPKGEENNFYYAHLLREMARTGYIKSLYRGIRERSSDFRFDTFVKLYLPIPPLSEQHAIVSFLDKELGKIDTYMEKEQQLIDRLKELKQSVIARAVTRGINPDAKMKPSGINWIGEIPEYWEIKSLRNFIKIMSDKGHPDEQLLSVVREQGVIIRNVESKEENHNFVPDDLSGYKLVKEGQFVINKMKAWQGSYAVSNYRGIVSPAYYTCDLIFENKEFFNEAIRSKAYVPFFTQYSKGIRVGQWDLSPISLKEIPFLLPPSDEQQAIVDYITTATTKIDKLIVEKTYELEYMKELRQRIISDAVTGKIDVRGFVTC